METILLSSFLVVFAAAAGFGIGAGNYKGILGAIIPGIIAGLVIAIPTLRDHQYLVSGIMVAGALAGSIACSLVADGNRLKRFLRTQTNLVIRMGSYKLGTKTKPPVETDED